MMPKAKRGGSPTGGGNFYIFKSGTPEQQAAALKFAKWTTAPERAADWSIATGYVAVTPAAWETEKMKKYAAEVPAATVARDRRADAAAGHGRCATRRRSRPSRCPLNRQPGAAA